MECLKLTFTCRRRRSVLLRKSLSSLAILALAELLRPVSPHVLAFSLALSIGSILSDGGLRRSFNLADVLPSYPAGLVGSSPVLPTLQASLRWLLL